MALLHWEFDSLKVKGRLLHIITGLGTGGAERALFALLSGGLAKRFDCAVLSLSDEGTMGAPIRKLGVPVHALGMRKGLPTPGTLVRLRDELRLLRPDVIQGWMYHGNLAASFAQKLSSNRPRLVWNIRHSLYDLGHEKPFTRHVIRANRTFSRGPEAIIYNSSLARNQHERFGLAGRSSVVIPNGFDLSQWRPDPKGNATVRREFGLDSDDLIVGHVARFHPMKDHATFLRAAVEVASRVSNARFLLVGREVHLNKPELRGIVPDNLVPRFIFAGEMTNVSRLVQAMDVLCSSSLSEAFPNVLGEAMASGVPCVTTDVGDCACIVGDTGFVVPSRDAAALAEAIAALLQMPREERVDLGARARDRVASRYGIDTIVGRYSDLYCDLIDYLPGDSAR